MKRNKAIKNYLNSIINECDSKDLFCLLFELQHIKILKGYAIATLMSFEESKITNQEDSGVLELMKNGEYDKMFADWLEEEL